eukprot:5041613-Prymnesium_polylepis.1
MHYRRLCVCPPVPFRLKTCKKTLCEECARRARQDGQRQQIARRRARHSHHFRARGRGWMRDRRFNQGPLACAAWSPSLQDSSL